MKYKTDYPKILTEMMSCISESINEKSHNRFNILFNNLKTSLHNDYFAPFEKEDIFLLAVIIDELQSTVNKYRLDKKVFDITKQHFNALTEIINLLNIQNDKNNIIIKKINQFNKLNIDEATLTCSSQEKIAIEDIIDKCKKTVIHVEYTIIKNS